MTNDKFFKVLISLLQSIEKNTGEVAKSFEDNYIVDVDDDTPVSIPKDIYNKICKELDSNDITFMGIT